MTDGYVLAKVEALRHVDDAASVLGRSRRLCSVHAAAGSQREAEQRGGGGSAEPNAAALVGAVGDARRAARALQDVQRLLLAPTGQRVHLLPTDAAVEVPILGGANGAGAPQRQNRKLHVASIGRDVSGLQQRAAILREFMSPGGSLAWRGTPLRVASKERAVH